jgi:hypothetical protein
VESVALGGSAAIHVGSRTFDRGPHEHYLLNIGL